MQNNRPSRPTCQAQNQRELARLARIERLLSGQLRRLIKPASELAFDYQAATAAARRTRGGRGEF